MLSETEVLRLKLLSIPAEGLRELARANGVKGKRVAELVKALLRAQIPQQRIDAFIRSKHEELVARRRTEIPDDALLAELKKVKTFSWGTVQGQLDNKIQVGYVRKYHCYEALLANVEKELYGQVKDYVICTWYNHWTTVIIEDLISTHEGIVPTLKNIRGVDLFFGGQPFDLKITYMPECFRRVGAVPEAKELAVWLYEHQGAQRFGADNRLFVVVYDSERPEESWKIKRDIGYVKENIERFFRNETVSQRDEIVFSVGNRTYTALTKVLLLSK